MISAKEVQTLIENAANEAAESGTTVTLEYIDKSSSYDGFGAVKEQRNIEIRVRATPPNEETPTVEIQGKPPYGE